MSMPSSKSPLKKKVGVIETKELEDIASSWLLLLLFASMYQNDNRMLSRNDVWRMKGFFFSHLLKAFVFLISFW